MADSEEVELSGRVYWRGKGQNGFTPGWAGDGECDVLELASRPGFGPDGTAGDAARIRLKARGGYTLWVPYGELEENE